MAQIIIPTPLRKFTDNQNKYSSTAGTVGGAIDELATEYPGLKNHLFGSDGEIRSFIKVFVGEDDTSIVFALLILLLILKKEKLVVKQEY